MCLCNIGSGLAHMRGVICSELVPAKFKTGMCEMKIFGLKFVVCFGTSGSGWIGTYAWCNMESCSGKVQNRDV